MPSGELGREVGGTIKLGHVNVAWLVSSLVMDLTWTWLMVLKMIADFGRASALLLQQIPTKIFFKLINR